MDKKRWLLIDATDKIIGRLASNVANILIGKSKTDYQPGGDNGDFVIIINSDEAKFTGRKLNHKFYYKNTGYPGGLRSINAAELMKKDSTEVLKKAVKGMLPKNRLGKKMLTKLKIYKDAEHPHQAQNPSIVDI